MKIKYTYWTAGDRLVERTLENVESVEAGIEALADDEQQPLSQVDTIEILEWFSHLKHEDVKRVEGKKWGEQP